ncbi:hypothetical protein ACQJBY_015734 [Aegilops geniculata]
MKSSQSPYSLAYDALLRWPLALADPSVCPIAHWTVPDSFSCSLQELNTEDFVWPKDYPRALPDQEKPSVTTLQGRPPHEAGWHGEVFRSPSSPEEDPSRTNFVEKGYDPNKINVSVIVLISKAEYFYY